MTEAWVVSASRESKKVCCTTSSDFHLTPMDVPPTVCLVAITQADARTPEVVDERTTRALVLRNDRSRGGNYGIDRPPGRDAGPREGRGCNRLHVEEGIRRE